MLTPSEPTVSRFCSFVNDGGPRWPAPQGSRSLQAAGSRQQSRVRSISLDPLQDMTIALEVP